MGEWMQLDSASGTISGWWVMPDGKPRGGVVIIQEIFGVNPHIREVAHRYAQAGFVALAPAFFDLIEPNIELPYDPSAHDRGRELVTRLGFDAALDVVSAAAKALSPHGRVGTVGYCWGGTVAFLSALRLGLPSVSYYGARNRTFLAELAPGENVLAPVMFHFGEHDASIPADVVQLHRDKLPDQPVYTYPAGHAFNRDVSAEAYDAESANLARSRSLAFLSEHVG